MASEWFEETKKRAEAVKKNAEGLKGSMETGYKVIKEANEAIAKYEMIRQDAMTAKDEAERILNYVKAEVKNAKEQAAKGAENYREYLESKAPAKAELISPSETSRAVPPYVLEQPAPAKTEPPKEPDISKLAAKATDGAAPQPTAQAPSAEPTPEKKGPEKDTSVEELEKVYKDISEEEKKEREQQEKQAKEQKALENKMTEALARYEAGQTDKLFEEMRKGDKDVYTNFWGGITSLFVKLQEGKFDPAINEAYLIRKGLEDYKAQKAAQPEGTEPEKQAGAADERRKKETDMDRGAKMLGDETAAFEAEKKAAAEQGMDVPEGIRKLEDAAKGYASKGDYSNAALALSGARTQLKARVERERKAQEEKLKKATGTAEVLYETDNKEYASVCEHLAKSEGLVTETEEKAPEDKDGKTRYTIKAFYDPLNEGEKAKVKELKEGFEETTSSVSKFKFTKEEYEALENNAAPIIEALEAADLVIAPGEGYVATETYRLKGGVPVALAKALKESAQKMAGPMPTKAEEKAVADRQLADAAENGEPDHVVYRTDKSAFAHLAAAALKKQRINAKWEPDPDHPGEFIVKVPEEVAKDRKFKPFEKELKEKTGKYLGLELDEYNAIMNAEGSALKEMLESLMAQGEVEDPTSFLTHYKIKNAPEAAMKYLKQEAMMIKTGAKPDEAEGQGVLTNEARVELYETMEINFLASMQKAQQEGVDTAEVSGLREKSKELFNKGEYKAATPMLVEAKKKLDGAIRRGLARKHAQKGAPKAEDSAPEPKPEEKAPEAKEQTETKAEGVIKRSDVDGAEALTDIYKRKDEELEKQKQEPPAPKEPEEKTEEQKKVKVSVPTKVYDYLSKHKDYNLSEEIVAGAKKGRVYGYNLEVAEDRAGEMNARIKAVKVEMKETKKAFKEMQKKKKEEEKLKKAAAASVLIPPPQEEETEKGPDDLGILNMGSGDEQPEEDAPKPPGEEEHTKPRIAKIRCPKCKEIMEIASPKRPLEIRCSSCNAKLLMKK